jgi:hypothetical protein
MLENSAAGLVMLAAEVTVTVTREEMHQPTLARYPVPPGGERRVAVELAWCTVGAGKYRGQRAIEVRLDGYRVGELTYVMSQRYASLMSQVTTAGGRAGCEGVIERTARDLQITLRLPRDTDGVLTFPAAAATAAAAKKKSSDRRAMWVVAASVVFVVFLLAAILGSGDDTPISGPASSDDTVTTTVEPPPTTTTTTTTTTTPPPTTTTTVPPPPPPATQDPVVPPVVVAPPPPPPAQAPSGCDPNYTGCVPIASDVDCAGGSGNGPAYANGPVQVIGSDIYDLDRDHDGTACE